MNSTEAKQAGSAARSGSERTISSSQTEGTRRDLLAWPLSIEEIYRKAASEIRRITEYDSLGILLQEETGDELRFAHAEGFPPEVVKNWRFGQGQGIVGTVVKSGDPLLVENVRQDPRYIAGTPHVLSELALPLGSPERLIGVVDLGSHTQGFFGPQLIPPLAALAESLAQAIDNARRHDRLRRQAETLSLLYELAREVSSVLDKNELLDRIARQVKRFADYQLFSLMLWNPERHVLELAFSLRYDERLRMKSEFPLGHGISGTAAALRQPLRIPDVDLDPRYVSCAHGVKVRSELAVPLLLEGRLVGVLDVESVRYNAFSQDTENLLVALGSYIAIALENARLYEKVVDNEKRLESDLDTAREVQKALLPEVPQVTGLDVGIGTEPALHLGGDFYDFLQLRGRGFTVAIGDVAGKATPAALYGSLAIGLLRAHIVQECCDPASVLARVDEQLRGSSLDNRFVSMILASFSSDLSTVTLANSGLPLPMLARKGQVQDIDSMGRPLGLLPDSRYDSTTLTLEKGDVLLLFSDGISEAPGSDGEEFGLDRIRGLLSRISDLPAQQIAERLMRESKRHSREKRQQVDDRTLLVVKRT